MLRMFPDTSSLALAHRLVPIAHAAFSEARISNLLCQLEYVQSLLQRYSWKAVRLGVLALKHLHSPHHRESASNPSTL
jgi:hypothetical protein